MQSWPIGQDCRQPVFERVNSPCFSPTGQSNPFTPCVGLILAHLVSARNIREVALPSCTPVSGEMSEIRATACSIRCSPCSMIHELLNLQQLALARLAEQFDRLLGAVVGAGLAPRTQVCVHLGQRSPTMRSSARRFAAPPSPHGSRKSSRRWRRTARAWRPCSSGHNRTCPFVVTARLAIPPTERKRGRS